MIKLKLDEATKEFLQECQFLLAFCFSYLFGVAVLALLGAFTGEWFLLKFATFPLFLAIVFGTIAGFLILSWLVGTKMQSILFRKLEVETEDND